MSSVSKAPLLTPEQYLEQGRRAPYKSEYYFGEVFAMAVATRAHNRISINVGSSLNSQLRGRRCET